MGVSKTIELIYSGL